MENHSASELSFTEFPQEDISRNADPQPIISVLGAKVPNGQVWALLGHVSINRALYYRTLQCRYRQPAFESLHTT